MNAVVTQSRFLTDKNGTYDLASVSAVIDGGLSGHGAVATLVTEGGNLLKTATPLATAVTAWTAYLDAPEPAPAAK